MLGKILYLKPFLNYYFVQTHLTKIRQIILTVYLDKVFWPAMIMCPGSTRSAWSRVKDIAHNPFYLTVLKIYVVDCRRQPKQKRNWAQIFYLYESGIIQVVQTKRILFPEYKSISINVFNEQLKETNRVTNSVSSIKSQINYTKMNWYWLCDNVCIQCQQKVPGGP